MNKRIAIQESNLHGLSKKPQTMHAEGETTYLFVMRYPLIFIFYTFSKLIKQKLANITLACTQIPHALQHSAPHIQNQSQKRITRKEHIVDTNEWQESPKKYCSHSWTRWYQHRTTSECASARLFHLLQQQFVRLQQQFRQADFTTWWGDSHVSMSWCH